MTPVLMKMPVFLLKECNMDLELSGKKVLVTGASQGIGKATIISFLEEGADILTILIIVCR